MQTFEWKIFTEPGKQLALVLQILMNLQGKNNQKNR